MHLFPVRLLAAIIRQSFRRRLCRRSPCARLWRDAAAQTAPDRALRPRAASRSAPAEDAPSPGEAGRESPLFLQFGLFGVNLLGDRAAAVAQNVRALLRRDAGLFQRSAAAMAKGMNDVRARRRPLSPPSPIRPSAHHTSGRPAEPSRSGSSSPERQTCSRGSSRPRHNRGNRASELRRAGAEAVSTTRFQAPRIRRPDRGSGDRRADHIGGPRDRHTSSRRAPV